MTPYRVYRDFIDSTTRASLFAWAMENEAKFEPSSVYTQLCTTTNSMYNPSLRKSLRASEFGPVQAIFRQRCSTLFPR